MLGNEVRKRLIDRHYSLTGPLRDLRGQAARPPSRALPGLPEQLIEPAASDLLLQALLVPPAAVIAVPGRPQEGSERARA